MFDPRGIMTTANAAYEQLNTRFKKISAIGDARGILGWDMLTIMPKGASEARGEAVATLDAISHEALTDPRVGDWLNEAEGNPPAEPDHQVNLAEMRRLYAHASAVEPALVEALSRAGSRCYQVWTEARPENRFDLFAPALTEVLGLVRQVAAAKSEALGLTPYDALIDQFHIRHVADKKAGELSYGQQKLVDIAMAFMSEPALVLLDEPCAGVNPSLVGGISRLLKQLNQERQGSFVVIEHNMEFVMGLCHRIMVMVEGQVLAIGTPDEIRANKQVLDAYLGN